MRHAGVEVGAPHLPVHSQGNWGPRGPEAALLGAALAAERRQTQTSLRSSLQGEPHFKTGNFYQPNLGIFLSEKILNVELAKEREFPGKEAVEGTGLSGLHAATDKVLSLHQAEKKIFFKKL